MQFIDRISEAHSREEVFDLVNAYIVAVRHTPELDLIPTALRPERIDALDEMLRWLKLVSTDIGARTAARDEIPDVLIMLHLILETASHKLRNGWAG